MFELLAAPPESKRLRIFEMGGHGALPRVEVINEVLTFLDRHLGPVAGAGSVSR